MKFHVTNNVGERVDSFTTFIAAMKFANKRSHQLCGARHKVVDEAGKVQYVTYNDPDEDRRKSAP